MSQFSSNEAEGTPVLVWDAQKPNKLAVPLEHDS